ncbi:hypothetical protein [Cellulomonas sp. RIT-PI-Y]|uniref:hypothetical protein n=1 Tax=Cellulomonas sp. RIT-PI-Y TaxID=3035297 RepID=UPI0021D8C5B9|nr:hypothetical protein [Cellulomonas sp. RIT-PI-Y]
MRPLSRAVPAVLALALVLTGCSATSSGNKKDDPRDQSTTASQDSTAEEDPEDTTLDTDYDVQAVDFGAPGAVTGPGTTLPFGTPAWLNQTETFGEQEVSGGVGVAVLEIRELDKSIYNQFSNAEEFEAYTPYAVITQHQWLYDTPEGYDPTTVDLFPIAADGTDTQYLTSGFSFNSPGDNCGLLLPEYDEETRTSVSCFVALAEAQPVTAAEYNGESYSSFIASSDNPYFPAPITWQ